MRIPTNDEVEAAACPDGEVCLTVRYRDIGNCCFAVLSRSRVERLRDWLTAWLDENPQE